MGKKNIAVKDSPLTKPTPRRGSKAPDIIQSALEHPDLTTRELGKLHDCSHVNVIETLQRYGIDRGVVENFISAERLIRAEKKRILLTSITDDEIKSMSVHNRIVDYGILDDKDKAQTAPGGIQVNIVIGDPTKTIDISDS